MLWKAAIVALLASFALLAGLNYIAKGLVNDQVAAQCMQDSMRPGNGPSQACTQSSQEIVNAPSDEVRRLFMIDNFFVVMFVATFVLIALAAGRTIFGSKPRSTARLLLVSVAIGVAFAAGAADVLENLRSLEVIRGRVAEELVSADVVREIANATMLKWLLLVSAVAISGLLVVLSLLARLFRGPRHAGI